MAKEYADFFSRAFGALEALEPPAGAVPVAGPGPGPGPGAAPVSGFFDVQPEANAIPSATARAMELLWFILLLLLGFDWVSPMFYLGCYLVSPPLRPSLV